MRPLVEKWRQRLRPNRKEHWEKVYAQKTPSEVSWYQTHPAVSLELISSTGIGKGF